MKRDSVVRREVCRKQIVQNLVPIKDLTFYLKGKLMVNQTRWLNQTRAKFVNNLLRQ